MMTLARYYRRYLGRLAWPVAIPAIALALCIYLDKPDDPTLADSRHVPVHVSVVPVAAPAASMPQRLPADETTDYSYASQTAWQQATEPAPPPLPEELPLQAPPVAERRETFVPLPVPEAANNIRLDRHADRISLTARDAPLASVLAMIGEQQGVSVVAGPEVTQRVTVTLNDVRLDEALDALLAINGYTWNRHNRIIIVSSIAAGAKSPAALQGRVLRVFSLSYIAAADVDKVVKGLLSPVGQSFANQSSSMDQRRAQEQVIVEDLPEYVTRIEGYIASVDRPARQVQVAAHVLQVTLKDDSRHGVNFDQLLEIANANVSVETVGMANGLPPASFIRIAGTSLDSVIEAIKTTTDAKTLASPKVAVLNGQEAKIQIGSQLGYFVTTTTQTSTLQSVNFLDTGVILHVTPVISDDNQVIMTVKPQVSSGRINPTTQLPESDTTEVQTKVMLMDGEAIVIGGLIKETDSDIQNKIPILGDIWLVGRLFQRRATVRERSEIIITLIPTIVPDAPLCRQLDPCEVARATTPLLAGPLVPTNRTVWEPELPNCYEKRAFEADLNCMPPPGHQEFRVPGPATHETWPHLLPPARIEEVWPAGTSRPDPAWHGPAERTALYRLPAVETEATTQRR